MGRFKSKKKADSQTPDADDTLLRQDDTLLRQTEAEKTARLRALRLAKEAADRETANRDAAAAIARRLEPRRRVPGSQISDPLEPK